MVLPVTPSGRMLLIRIYRHPIKRYLWEFPAGGIETEESPEEAGARELLEETGVIASEIRLLGSLVPIGPLVGEQYHAVVASVPEIELSDINVQVDEGIVEAKLVTPTQLMDMVSLQQIEDGVTLANLARYWAQAQ
ncbi:NUDIX hydrolase [Dehalococcoides mccartyi]|nr:NUDIX hydrolase [Dehalococcoides mccartyi]